jgi:hypothetical protein
MRRGTQFLALALGALFFLSPANVAANPLTDCVMVLEDAVKDLRPNSLMRDSATTDAGDYSSIEDLQVGDIFISADGTALKVTAINTLGDNVTIETEQPNLSDVMEVLEIPDQSIALNASNVSVASLQSGVTLNTGVAPRYSSRGLPTGPTWLDTDTDSDIQRDSVISFNLNIGKNVLPEDDNKDENSNDNSNDNSAESGDGSSDGSTESETDVSLEFGIQGTVRLANPILKVGLKKPVMHIKWVTKWYWPIGYPVISFDKGYIHASFEAAEQIDCTVFGKLSISHETKIPIAELIVMDPDTTLFAKVEVFARITVDGSITLTFEVNQYLHAETWGTCTLVWPFIPTGVTSGSDFYYDFAVRPTVSAEVEAKAGLLYLGAAVGILGQDLISIDVGGGLYLTANGFIEATDVVGYDKNVGSYGSWANWYYRIQAELGGYVDSTLKIICWEKTLFDKRWPFLTLDFHGET